MRIRDVVPRRLLHQKPLVRRRWKIRPWMKTARKRIIRATRRKMRMQMRRAGAKAAWSPSRKVLALPIVTLIGTATAAVQAGPSSAKQRMRRMVSSGNFQ